MVIKKRENKIIKVETEVKQEKNSHSVSTFNESNINLRTYKDEICEALDMLEKEGINIYDENNTPGMYLYNHSKTEIPVVLKHLLEKKSKKDTIINNTEKEENSIPNNLLQFLKNKNK